MARCAPSPQRHRSSRLLGVFAFMADLEGEAIYVGKELAVRCGLVESWTTPFPARWHQRALFYDHMSCSIRSVLNAYGADIHDHWDMLAKWANGDSLEHSCNPGPTS
jgi:hypothetical protein